MRNCPRVHSSSFFSTVLFVLCLENYLCCSSHSDHDLIDIISKDSSDSPRTSAFAIWIMMERHGNEFEVNGSE